MCLIVGLAIVGVSAIRWSELVVPWLTSATGIHIDMPLTALVAWCFALGAAWSTASQFVLNPVHLPSAPSYDRKSHRVKANRRRKFPAPYPNGWYRVCSAADLEGGRVHSISALGREMVAFRGERNGEIGVLHAYCPHLGAHLGQGGCVRGNTIACPFHGWAFNAAGKCTNIPYSKTESAPPLRAKTKVRP